VHGEPQRTFNLLTSPTTSLNAQFVEVPKAFVGEDITDTVLGDVGIAACGPRDEMLFIHFDVATGRLNVTVDDEDQGNPPAAAAAPRASNRGVAAMAAAHGTKLVLERYVCDLRRMGCGWEEVEDGAAPAPLKLPQLELGFSRAKVRTDKVQIVATRNAMVNLGGGGEATAAQLDCSLVAAWPMARDACMRLVRGTAPPAKQQEWLLLLVTPTLRPEQRFHFMQVDLPLLQYEQPQVHGLLGQRAIAPRPVDEAAAARAHKGQQTAAAEARRRSLYEEESAAATMGLREGAGVDGRAGAASSSAAAAAAAAAADEAAKPMLHAAIEALGLQQEAAKRFGSQGEGAIAGRWAEYAVSSIDAHHRFRYSRLACGGG